MDKTDRNTIEELLPRYCEGVATEEERLQVEMWMSESDENRRMAKQIHALFLATDTVNVMKKVDTEKALSRVKSRMTGKRKTTCGSNFVHSTSRYIDAPILGRKRTGIGTNHGSENKSWDDDLIDPARWYACLSEFGINTKLSFTFR